MAGEAMLNGRVPVMSGLQCVEMADASRVRRLGRARNAMLIRRHKDGMVVEVQIREHGDDSKRRGRMGNPRRYSFDHETPENPRNVWTLKRIPRSARRVFTAVADSCAA